MSRERLFVERDPINLAVVALGGAVNMFIEKGGLKTLLDGVPEHLLVLIAAFADAVPPDDVRFTSTLEAMAALVHRADRQESLRGDGFSPEERAEYRKNLRQLMDGFEDPWEIQGLVAEIRAVNVENGIDRRAWEKAFRFQTIDQNTPLSGEAAGRPSPQLLHEMAAMEEGRGLPSAKRAGLSLARPDERTVPPKRLRPPVVEAHDQEPDESESWGRSEKKGKHLEWRPGRGRLKQERDERDEKRR